MKVLHVIYSLQVGGAEKLLVDLLPSFKEQGIDADILVFNTQQSIITQLCEQRNIKVYTLNGSKPYSLQYIYKLIPFLKRYDIIHTHTTPAQYFVAIAKAISFSNCKLITTEHSTNNRRRDKFIFKLLDKIVYSFYCRIICISEVARRNLVQHIGRASKVLVVENGVNLSIYSDALACSKESLGCNKDNCLLVMVGRFCAAKDQETIIRALTFLPENIVTVFVGGGENLERCKSLAVDLGVKERTKFLGVRGDVPNILKCCDIVIMSSFWEGLSLASVEGMASGKPTVASDVQGLREVVGNAGILFQQGDYMELSKIITSLINNEDQYKKVAELCAARSSQYDIRNTALNYLHIYRMVLQNN